MIEHILDILKEKNAVEASDLSDYEYYFNNRANINLFLYSKKEKKPLLFIKMSDLRNFESSFNRMKIIYDLCPRIIPEPVCCFNLNNYSVLVTRAYDINLLISNPGLNDKKIKILLHNIVDNITELHLKTVQGQIQFNDEFCQKSIVPVMDDFFKKWSDDSLLQEFKSYLKRLSGYSGISIPSIPQHGDLVIYNTGFINGRVDNIVFVDWDSYSDITLPVYDILIFLNSFVAFYGKDIYADSEFHNYARGVFNNYCSVIGIDREFAMDLYPLCLLLFAGTKADIGIFSGQESALRRIKRFFVRRDDFFLLHPSH